MQKANLKNESGRSMVEMLGVLAIVGVLSVGGVYGYGVAMKKHKANELLHQASMHASSIAAQIASGKETLSLKSFADNNSYGTFGNPQKINAEQFTLTISSVESGVCNQLKAGGIVRDVTCGTVDANGNTTATLKFNNNLSSDAVAVDYNNDTTGESCTNGGFKWCSGKGENGSCSTSDDCCSGVTLNGCQESCDSTTGEITPKDDGIDCTNDNGKEGTCSDGVCEVPCLTSGSCMNNEGLCEGYYCRVGGECNNWATNEYIIREGDITALPSQPISKSNGYHKGGIMTWDAAYYYCQALKARGDITSGLAGRWNNYLPDDDYYWLNLLYPSGSTPTSNNSCLAFYVGFGRVLNIRRDGGGYYSALCE